MAGKNERANNFGSLRVILATLVIVSHSPLILDGNTSREIFKRIFGTLSLGDVAVDGFFLISGYLVTKSFLRSDSITAFVEKRVLRILPGFIASFWLCALLVGPLAGAPMLLKPSALLSELANSITLQSPISVEAFRGMPVPELNGSMWTIRFEFGCYIATMCLGLMGLFSRKARTFTLIVVMLLLLANMISPIPRGYPLASFLRFGALFGTGANYYLFRDKIRFTNWGMFASAFLLTLLLFSNRWAEASLAILGGYLLFGIAFKLPVLRLSLLMNKTDLSYGIYLYAWPIASLIAWRYRTINPWLLTGLTLTCSIFVAYLSWTFIEKPCLSLITRESPSRKAIGAGAASLRPAA